jgi:uncharacterized protein
MLALIYDLSDDYLERRVPLREEHLALIHAAHARGELLQAGPFSDPYDRSLLIWSTDDTAVVERFIDADPYLEGGVVTGWQIRKWNVAIDPS